MSAGSSSKQTQRMRKPTVVPHLDSQVYVELDDQMHLKQKESKGISLRVWTDEIIEEDEEKTLPPIGQDAITDISRRHEYYNRK